jgi:hypothetical protein
MKALNLSPFNIVKGGIVNVVFASCNDGGCSDYSPSEDKSMLKVKGISQETVSDLQVGDKTNK